MVAIDQIIRQAVNPFDPTTFKPGNFWHEEQDPALHVESIHQQVMQDIEAVLALVMQDHRTRTLMLYGDSGSGKTHLLGRLKQTLSPKAFFVYIDPFPESDALWRHILRYTVDSLIQVPAGQQESQLLLWLKSLSIFKQSNLVDWVLSDRQKFIRSLKASYPTGIYNASQFFGVLYDLINPELYALACDWLRGDDLDEDSLKALRVQRAIETENAAQKILANFGRIAAETQPIVLCFDQLDNIARTADGVIDLQALFSVNSSIHNQALKNFLVIISIITSTWKQNVDRVQATDSVRIDTWIPLKSVDLRQAEALWASRLHPLHQQANPRPESPIYPLTAQMLAQKFPGGKTYPRNVLELGRRLLQGYKVGPTHVAKREDAIAAFKLVWLQEFNKTQAKITRIRQLAAPELIQMLKEVLMALQVGEMRSRLLPSPTYASHSFSYQPANAPERVGITWNEDPNLTSFYHVMNACRRVVELNLCHTLHLIRSEDIGGPGRRGYELFNHIFTQSPHQHIQSELSSVHYLATYHSLVNAAYAGELVVAGETLNISALEALVRKSKILRKCPLLQALGVIPGKTAPSGKQHRSQPKVDLPAVQEFLLDLVTNHQLLGRQVMIQTALDQFPQLRESDAELLIKKLCRAQKIQILDAQAKPTEQLVCLVSNTQKG
ncbi:MAG: ATP-binding protein [Cyanothece sp. SIO1E1]|nr:ATP-binding protein [Cyanothece sp. SIO1E1]